MQRSLKMYIHLSVQNPSTYFDMGLKPNFLQLTDGGAGLRCRKLKLPQRRCVETADVKDGPPITARSNAAAPFANNRILCSVFVKHPGSFLKFS